MLPKASTNKNFQQSQNYSFVLDRTPTVVYNLQGMDFPGITLNPAQVMAGPMSNEDMQYPGEKIVYDPLTLRIMLDEDMVGYFEIVNWMLAASIAPGYTKDKTKRIKELTDASLLITTNKFRINKKFRFLNIWPTNIGPISFDYTIGPDVVPIYDVIFVYQKYTFE